MSNPLTIQLPPNLEQQMLHQAQQQNTSLENLALRSLQKDYGVSQEINPASINSLEDFFNAIRTAIQTGQPVVQAPANPLYLQIAESLKSTGILLDLQSSNQTLTLHINPTPPPPVIPSFPDMDPSELDPKIAKIIQDLKHEDETVRYHAIQAIAQWHEQQS
jgi:ribosomal protein S8